MPKAVRQQGDPTQLRNSLNVMFDDADMELIRRVATRYGVSKSAAARLLLRAGAPHHDPSPPEETSK